MREPVVMPSILILNTALERPCALITRDSAVIAKYARETRQSAQIILRLAREALDEAELKRTEAVAVVAGPGSFTGTRIGIAAAQGLAAAWDVPALPISTLALTAAAARRLHPADAYLAGRKARGDQLYFGCYQAIGDGLALRGVEQAGALADLRLEPVEARDWLAVGDGWLDAGAIESRFDIQLQSEPIPVAVEAVDLATLAQFLWKSGKFVDADLLRPNYVEGTPRYREQSGSG